MSTTSMRKSDARVLAFAVVYSAALATIAPTQAQELYKYRDARGVWVYTDRPPDAAVAFERLPIERSETEPVVELFEREHADGTYALVARNPFYGTVQIAFELLSTSNVAADVPQRGNRILDPRTDTELFPLERVRLDEPLHLEYGFQYLHGRPGAKHAPPEPYRLPYALASDFVVSQAFPDRVSHTDEANRHAIDFVMPVGTGVYAARGGVVIEVASDYFESGVDLAVDGPRANIVRVLHDDGTMALYAHLNLHSIRVAPGQRVARGEHLADSGNTGFSTGPHLHFVVQRNAGGVMESVPIEFSGPGGTAFTVATGDHPTAY
jgi:murein DD-endopeptidase MepM/ murein hydrolase activator NlpD